MGCLQHLGKVIIATTKKIENWNLTTKNYCRTNGNHLKWSRCKVLGTTDSRNLSVITSDPSSGFRLVTLIYIYIYKQRMSPLNIVLPPKDRNIISLLFYLFGADYLKCHKPAAFWPTVSWSFLKPYFLTHPHLGPFSLDFRSRALGAQFTIFLLHMYWFSMIIKIGTYYRPLVGKW